MQTRYLAVAALIIALLSGCSTGTPKEVTPKAVTPLTEHDFGNVPVTTNMKDVRTQAFMIKNEGMGDLRLSNLQVKVLEGC